MPSISPAARAASLQPPATQAAEYQELTAAEIAVPKAAHRPASGEFGPQMSLGIGVFLAAEWKQKLGVVI